MKEGYTTDDAFYADDASGGTGDFWIINKGKRDGRDRRGKLKIGTLFILLAWRFLVL